MDNKAKISILKNYAELAWAGYFFFDLAKGSKGNPRTIYELDKNGEKIVDTSFPRGYKERETTLEHIVSKKYQGQEVLPFLEEEKSPDKKLTNTFNTLFNKEKLNGEFSSIQAQKFCKRYELIFHQPNTSSGFSATLFYDTQEDKYIVSFRGTETNMPSVIRDIFQDISLTFGHNPQSSDLLDFLKEVSKIVRNKNIPVIFVGHSLGGYLAQVAYIYCEKNYKETLAFSPSEVYTFNAPSVYGWYLPAPFLSPNIIKIALDFLGKNIIDISEKITHIFDDGGVELIASAQYGSENRLALYTGENSHSIVPITKTLYFYEYLLTLPSNEDKIKGLSFNQGIEYLNSFINKIETLYSHPLTKANEDNARSFEIKNGPFAPFREEPEKIVLLSLFFSTIAFALHKSKSVLTMQGESYYTQSLQPYVSKGNVIDFILELFEENIHIKILELEDFKKIKNDYSFLNTKEGNVYKACLAQYQNFIITNKEDKPIQTQEELLSLYGYNSRVAILLSRQWDELFAKSICKSIEGIYFGGGVKILVGAEK